MSPFPSLEPQNPWIHEFYVAQERGATDFKASKLWKGSSGDTTVPYKDFTFQIGDLGGWNTLFVFASANILTEHFAILEP